MCAWPVWQSGVVSNDGFIWWASPKGKCRLVMACHLLSDRGKNRTPAFPGFGTGRGNQKRKQVEQRLGRQRRELISLRTSAGWQAQQKRPEQTLTEHGNLATIPALLHPCLPACLSLCLSGIKSKRAKRIHCNTVHIWICSVSSGESKKFENFQKILIFSEKSKFTKGGILAVNEIYDISMSLKSEMLCKYTIQCR